MVDRIRTLLERFPEDDAAVRVIIKQDRYFDTLCQEYAEIGIELDDVGEVTDPERASLADALRKRRVAIEEELLTKIEGYRPI